MFPRTPVPSESLEGVLAHTARFSVFRFKLWHIHRATPLLASSSLHVAVLGAEYERRQAMLRIHEPNCWSCLPQSYQANPFA